MRNTKTILQLLLIALSLVALLNVTSCSKDCNCGSNSTNTIPIGTTVKYEVIADTSSTILGVSYRDEQENNISKLPSSPSWSYSFQTTKVNQIVLLAASCNNSTKNVTGRIYINNVLKKEAKANSVSLFYP